ncbi:MAG: acetyl-CoA C-acyltransferase [Chromatiales bacterium]|nr:acetyl-CoA C-acyltransferase [Chromatiales bacterium]
MQNDSVVILSALRTPIGSFQGKLSPLTAPQLAAAANRAVLEQAGIDPVQIEEVVYGCVLPAGVGQAPARQGALAAGIPESVGAVTVNKMCGSGMKAVMFGHDMIASGSADLILAGGMESMSNAPYLLPKARAGYRMGHQEVLDHMFYDGLQNVYDGQMMGVFAEATAEKYGFTREEQDEFSTESVNRALQAISSGAFADEIVPVTVEHRRKTYVVEQDEEPGRCDIEGIPKLRAAFKRDGGTVTAASSSSISDGAASVLLASAARAEALGIKPLATIRGHSTFAHAPAWFTTAPVGAIKNLQEKLGWSNDEVDLYEINEAFAVVTMAAIKDLGLDHAKVNVNGGACALGHPIGATGARIITTLVHALKRSGGKRGIAALCIGGGEATAIAVELA